MTDSPWKNNGGRRPGSGQPPKIPLATQLASLDRSVLAARLAEELRLAPLRRAPLLCSPESPTRVGRVG